MSDTAINTELATLARKADPDEARNKRIAEAFLDLARGFEIKTQEDYNLATEELRKIIDRHGTLDAERKTFTDPLRGVLDRLNAKYMPWLKLLRGDGTKAHTDNAEAILKAKMAGFLKEQERLAAEARRRAEADAQAERDRQAKIAADQRAAAEKAEAEAAAARGKKAREAAEARAEEARRAAVAAETTAAVVIAQPATVAVAKGQGISTPKSFDFEVENKLALLEYIVKFRPDLAVLVAVDDVKMRLHVKMQGAATDLPGVRVFEKVGIRVTR